MFGFGAFPLPDGRILGLQRAGGGSSIAAFAEDQSPTAFVATRGNSSSRWHRSDGTGPSCG
jgi:hypothetical protein